MERRSARMMPVPLMSSQFFPILTSTGPFGVGPDFYYFYEEEI